MQGGSLTIGRGAANDLVLPDPDRLLSKNHCVIEDHGGNVVVVDLSTNGTYLNYSREPLGPTPTPLNNGDVLSVGGFELVVSITSDSPFASGFPDPLEPTPLSPGQAASAPDPMALLDDAGPGGDFLDDLLGAETPTGPSQIDVSDPIDELLPPAGEDEDPFFQKPSDGREGEGASMGLNASGAHDSMPTPRADRSIIPDDWDDLLGPDDGAASQPSEFAPPQKPAAPRPAPPPEADFAPPQSRQPAPEDPPQRRAKPAPAPRRERAAERAEPPRRERREETVPARPSRKKAKASGTESRSDDPARVFLEALGAEDLRIADEDLVETMERAGEVMRLLVEGIREILMTRTSIKSEFRIEQTRIGAGANNPLKFSISPDQAIEVLLSPRKRGYLAPETAAQEALDDIKAHEVAMVAGMESAIKGVLGKLSPDVLAGKIEDSGRLTTLLRGKKAQYWDIYEKMYGEISDQAENDFHDFFSREFAIAYKQQLDRLKG